MPPPEIKWDAPAQLDGLPYTNWKKRSGYTDTGTLAKMVQRWLDLPWHIKGGCHLSWTQDGIVQSCIGNEIGGLVLYAGLPPQMLATRAKPPTRQEIERMVAKPKYRDPPSDGPRGHFNPYGKSGEAK